jgi:hypothetical protein
MASDVFGVRHMAERLCSRQDLLSFHHDLRLALDGYRDQIRKLGQAFLRTFPYTRYYITFKSDKEGDRDYLYPIFRKHNKWSKKGNPRGDYIGPRLARYRCAAKGDGVWWRKTKSLIEVFNKWVRSLRSERSRILELCRELQSLVEKSRQSLVAKFPATHNAGFLAHQEIGALKKQVTDSLLAKLPPIPKVGHEL